MVRRGGEEATWLRAASLSNCGGEAGSSHDVTSTYTCPGPSWTSTTRQTKNATTATTRVGSTVRMSLNI
jgi:hypothetical protein